MIINAKRLRALLVLDLIALLFAVSFAAVTAPGPAERALGRSVAILTQVDTYLDGHFQSIQQQAAQTQEQNVTLPDFPIAVSFTPQEVRQAGREQFRALLLERAAAVLHDQGMSAFRQGRASEGSFFSAEGAIRTGMDLFRPVPHRLFVGLTIALGLAGALLALTLAQTTQGDARLQTLGLSTLLASVAFLALAVAVRFVFRLAAVAADDYLAHEFLGLGRQLTWAPIRDGLIVMVGGLSLVAAGAALKTPDRPPA
jgi:hypothetical protein